MGLSLSLLAGGTAVAQEALPVDVASEVFVNSEMERYLRVLQVAGLADSYPWSIRAFSPLEVERLRPLDGTHPWARTYDLRPDSATNGGLRLLRPQARLIYNSAFPFGSNDGAIWAGRGLTSSLTAGLAYRRGPLAVTVAPLVFRAENSSFDLQSTGLEGRLAFAHGRTPTGIDLPQRFGASPYTRLDPGQSTIRLDSRGWTVGISTANQHWGPAASYPIILGSNAPGFLHGFIGTSTPADLGYVQLHGRLIGGVLEQSDYSSVKGPASRRFAYGAVALLTPRGVSGLELGGSWFLHTPASTEGLPVRDTIASGVGNHLASVFFRWAFPRGGMEVYGEYGREDRSGGLRDLLLEPDHIAAYMLGLRKVWTIGDSGRLVSLRGEVLNAQRSQLLRGRWQGSGFYTHSGTRQGHTQRGQVLGATAAVGGSGAELALDLYHPGGRWTVSWSRELRQERGAFLETRQESPDGLDVLHALTLEGVYLRGRWEAIAGLTAGYNLNRYFAGDELNWNMRLAVRRAW